MGCGLGLGFGYILPYRVGRGRAFDGYRSGHRGYVGAIAYLCKVTRKLMTQHISPSIERPIILAIDSSTPTRSVALGHGDELLYHCLESNNAGDHAARLAPMVEEALGILRTRALQLDAIAVGAGPGSYTGLRISSSLAKGLAMGYGVPLIAISTLECMAQGYRATHPDLSPDVRLCPMLDARRMEVYTASFASSLERLSQDRPEVLGEGAPWEDWGTHSHHLFGSGAPKAEGLWTGAQYTITALEPDARYLLPLAEQAHKAGQWVDVAYWAPSYLKDYVATIARNKVLGR